MFFSGMIGNNTDREKVKRKISTNSHIGRDRLNSAFRQYGEKTSNEKLDPNYVQKSPLIKGKNGE